MSVVVTGAAGFIGRHLSARLLADGRRVVGIDRRADMPAGVVPLLGDLCEPDDAMRTAFAEAEAVFHLAGCPGVRDRSAEVARRRLRDNVVATERVLALTPPGTTLVVTSSSSVYGGARLGAAGPRACRESDRPAPLGGYARSKLELERRCAARAERGGHVAVVRPFTVVGEGQRPDMALARWLAAGRAGRPLLVLGSPERRRDLTDVRDVVEGLVRAATRAVDGTLNLGTGHGHSLAQMIGAVRAALRTDVALELAPAPAVEPAATLADTSRCRRLLGFVPSTDLLDVVARQAAAASPAPEFAAPEHAAHELAAHGFAALEYA